LARSAARLSFTVISYTETADGILFKVHVVPRPSCTEIVGEHNGAFRVRIAAAPMDGAANEAVACLLALAFKVSRKAVHITAGYSSKIKKVSVTGAAAEALPLLLRATRVTLTARFKRWNAKTLGSVRFRFAVHHGGPRLVL